MWSLKRHPHLETISAGGDGGGRQHANARPLSQQGHAPCKSGGGVKGIAEKVALYGRCPSPRSAAPTASSGVDCEPQVANHRPRSQPFSARIVASPTSDRGSATPVCNARPLSQESPSQLSTRLGTSPEKRAKVNGIGKHTGKVATATRNQPLPTMTPQMWLVHDLGLWDPIFDFGSPHPNALESSVRSGEGCARPLVQDVGEGPSAGIGVVRAQDRLFDLLGSGPWAAENSKESFFDNDTRTPYHRFIRGYVNASRHPSDQRLLQDAVTEIVGEECEEYITDRPHHRTDNPDDHYNFFARCASPAETVCANREDNDRRLKSARMQFLGLRMPLKSWHEKGPKGGVNLDGQVDLYAWPAIAGKSKKHGQEPTSANEQSHVKQESLSSSEDLVHNMTQERKAEGTHRRGTTAMHLNVVVPVVSDEATQPPEPRVSACRSSQMPGAHLSMMSNSLGVQHEVSCPAISGRSSIRTSRDSQVLRDGHSLSPSAHGSDRKSMTHGKSLPVEYCAGSEQKSVGSQSPRKSTGADRRSMLDVQGSEKRNSRLPRKSHDNNVNSAAATSALKAEMRTREACESLRFLVFGYQIEDKRTNGAFYDQSCGSREEVVQLHKIWNQMDEDGSGDIEFQEFLSFFSKSKADRLMGMRCVKYLVGSGMCDTGDDDKPMGCRIEDMMRLIWLKASQPDIETMMHWFREAEYKRDRAPTPPLLPKRKRREILENFPMLEVGQPVTLHDLRESGLVEADAIKKLAEDCPGSMITEDKILEMLCPNGYRPSKDARLAADNQGRSLEYINNEYFAGWIYTRCVETDD